MNACHSGTANRQMLAIAHLQGEGHFFVYADEGFYPLEFIIHIVPLIAKTVSKMLADYSGTVGIVGEFSEAWAVFRHQFSQITGGGIHRAGNNCHFVLVAVGSRQIKRLCRTISIAKLYAWLEPAPEVAAPEVMSYTTLTFKLIGRSCCLLVLSMIQHQVCSSGNCLMLISENLFTPPFRPLLRWYFMGF